MRISGNTRRKLALKWFLPLAVGLVAAKIGLMFAQSHYWHAVNKAHFLTPIHCITLVHGIPAFACIALLIWLNGRLRNMDWRGTLRWIGFARMDARQLMIATTPFLVVATVYGLLVLIGVRIVWAPEIPAQLYRIAIAVVFEEILFRGFIYRNLRVGRLYAWAGIMSALLFYAVHISNFVTSPTHDLMDAIVRPISYIGCGMALAYIYERGGYSIWGALLFHFCANLDQLAYIQWPGKLGRPGFFFLHVLDLCDLLQLIAPFIAYAIVDWIRARRHRHFK